LGFDAFGLRGAFGLEVLAGAGFLGAAFLGAAGLIDSTTAWVACSATGVATGVGAGAATSSTAGLIPKSFLICFNMDESSL